MKVVHTEEALGDLNAIADWLILRPAMLSGITIARQDLRGAADGAAEGVIEGGPADLPAMRAALPFHLPLAGPCKFRIVPCEPPDQGDLPVELRGTRGQGREPADCSRARRAT